MFLDDKLKDRREAFVSGLMGTTVVETLACAALLPAAVLLWRATGANVMRWRVPAELALVAGPILWGCTIAADHVGLIIVVCMMAACFGQIRAHLRGASLSTSGPESFIEAARRIADQRRKTFVTNFRAGMMIGTITAILGVDFPVFPRRFAKTETFGVSLMDLGVGGVLFASALTSRQARALSALMAGSSPRAKRAKEAGATSVASALLSVAPIIAIGSAKSVVHAALNLQNHVSEYGTHWNFFYTVAAITLASVLCEAGLAAAWRACSPGRLRRSISAPLAAAGIATVAAAIAFLHQQLLRAPLSPTLARELGASCGAGDTVPTLQAFILTGARPQGSFLAQNREGIFGVPGFFAVYLVGLAFGVLVMDPARRSGAQWLRFVPRSGCLVTAAWGAYVAAVSAFGPASRRLVNAPYVAFVAAVCGTVLWLLLAVEILTFTSPPGVSETGGDELADQTSAVQTSAVDPASSTRRKTRLTAEASPKGKPRRRASRSRSSRSARGAAALAVSQSVATGGGSVAGQSLAAADAALSDGRISILEAINSNFLASFMWANLLTGAVNATVDSLDTPVPAAMAILCSYVVAAVALPLALWRRGIVIKL